MKKSFLFLLALSTGLFISCEKDADHDDCHECHIALVQCCDLPDPHDPAEHEIEIPGGEFCGDDLADIEANGWVATEDIMHDGVVVYAVDALVPASMIHCEEHADHDH